MHEQTTTTTTTKRLIAIRAYLAIRVRCFKRVSSSGSLHCNDHTEQETQPIWLEIKLQLSSYTQLITVLQTNTSLYTQNRPRLNFICVQVNLNREKFSHCEQWDWWDQLSSHLQNLHVNTTNALSVNLVSLSIQIELNWIELNWIRFRFKWQTSVFTWLAE